ADASERHATIEVDAPAPMSSVEADGPLVRQALLAILRFAIDSAPTGRDQHQHGPIVVRLKSHDANTIETAVTFDAMATNSTSSALALGLARSVAEAHRAPFRLEGDTARVTIAIRWP